MFCIKSKTMRKKIGIVGTSGITATELIKILVNHKDVKITHLLSSSQSKEEIKILKKKINLSEKIILLSTFDKDSYKELNNENLDLLFLCLPHKVSMEFVKNLIDVVSFQSLPKIIDLSADFRIKDINLYEKFYECKHLLPQLLEKFVYGLPEINKEKKQQIVSSNFVANPGCYPTTIILGLAPIISKYNIDEIIIDAKSGYSGGGKKLVDEYESYGGNNTYPYNASGKHRHIPEIKEQLSKLANKNINFLFTPYVVPQYQGMLTTIYIKITNCKLQIIDLYNEYKSYYKNCQFIRILPLGKLAQTKNVIKTNYCDISFAQEENSNWIKIFVAIDNLIKGAAGQSVQNMNLMFGFDEKEGII